jgi:hypothetical protein
MVVVAWVAVMVAVVVVIAMVIVAVVGVVVVVVVVVAMMIIIVKMVNGGGAVVKGYRSRDGGGDGAQEYRKRSEFACPGSRVDLVLKGNEQVQEGARTRSPTYVAGLGYIAEYHASGLHSYPLRFTVVIYGGGGGGGRSRGDGGGVDGVAGGSASGGNGVRSAITVVVARWR